jgi:hypothetical protein
MNSIPRSVAASTPKFRRIEKENVWIYQSIPRSVAASTPKFRRIEKENVWIYQ